MDTNEMRQKRAALLTESRALLEQAKIEKRNLTASETREIDVRNATVDELGKQVEAIEMHDRLERQEAGVIAVSRPSPAEGVDNGPHILTRSQSMADYARSHIPTTSGEQLSLGKYLRGVATGNWQGAGAEQRAMSETLGGGGDTLVPTPLSAQLIDLARAKSVVFRAGAQIVPMDSSTLRFARQASDLQGVWRGELEAVTSTDMLFESVELFGQESRGGRFCVGRTRGGCRAGWRPRGDRAAVVL